MPINFFPGYNGDMLSGYFGFSPPGYTSGNYNPVGPTRVVGSGGGGGSSSAYYNYLASIYGSDTAAKIAEMNNASAQEVERIRQGGALDVANVGLEGDKYRSDTQFDIAGLQDATNRYGIDSAERLGQYKTGGDIYGQELAYDLGQSRNATDRYAQDVNKYGLDVGREVAGMQQEGETGRARIGASQGALSDILRDTRRGQVMSSPLLSSIFGGSMSDLLGSATGALGMTPGAATAPAKQFSFDAKTPYDSQSTVATLLSQITGQGQPQASYPKAGDFSPSAATMAPAPIAQRPGAPAPVQQGKYQPPPQRANQTPAAPQAPAPIPMPTQGNARLPAHKEAGINMAGVKYGPDGKPILAY